ncbi:hypothetical protein CWI37_0776p0010 [Hamiltosporidium tvaerminnensis]|uniref:Uncharacterized protein n=1 Tax=Hamiltosporidium tvaerminnensis TaxID=1176355 RepID=A0A4Q9L1E4_9MICR|nr:hypothetical protein CWI37_0776p0010 [Hamiltosporidium tvaerminnensis]
MELEENKTELFKEFIKVASSSEILRYARKLNNEELKSFIQILEERNNELKNKHSSLLENLEVSKNVVSQYLKVLWRRVPTEIHKYLADKFYSIHNEINDNA